jgi:hypothetical protein
MNNFCAIEEKEEDDVKRIFEINFSGCKLLGTAALKVARNKLKELKRDFDGKKQQVGANAPEVGLEYFITQREIISACFL